VGYQDTFKALSDKTRREILNLLKTKTMTAGDIASKFDMTQATVSHHLSVLKEAELVTDKKDGKYIYYELNTSVLDDIISWAITLKGENVNEK